MPPRSRARSARSGPSPLSETDVTTLRERLESGKKPRVVLLVDTALGAAGTSVPIVGFEEPAVGEFISVRLRDDVVPFSPNELSMPTRGRAAKAAPAPPAPLPLETNPSPAPPPYEPAEPPRLVSVPPPAEGEAPAKPPAKAVAGKEAPAKAAPAQAVARKAAAKRPARPGNISVTLRFSGKGWTYESTRGGRRSAARPLTLAAVRALSDRLDDHTLRRDLQNTIDSCRQEAQSRAETLRAQLERVEVELAELDD